MTPLQRHIGRWEKGCGAGACKTANNICLGRGQVPCDILFVAEAPGSSEDTLGSVLIGPAGKLFDMIIRPVVPPSARLAYTNLVGCMPKDTEGSKFGEPDDDTVRQCQPRLKEYIRICDPQLIVCVGKLAGGWLDPGYAHSPKLHQICSVCRHIQFTTKSGSTCQNRHDGVPAIPIPKVEVDHPAYILREFTQQGLLIQRCQAIIRGAVEEMVGVEW